MKHIKHGGWKYVMKKVVDLVEDPQDRISLPYFNVMC